MRAPRFWWQERPALFAQILSPLAHMWGFAAGLRMQRMGMKTQIPVICIGNFVVGGAGKTPLALAIMQVLQAKGEYGMFLTRGYGGARIGPIPVQVDLVHHQAGDVGDEALLLARQAPTLAGIDRVAGVKLAESLGASLVVMDDGFQNPSLKKSVSILAVDAETGIGNGLCVPAGPLRAPLSVQRSFVDALMLIGEGEAGERLIALLPDVPVFRAHVQADPVQAEQFKNQKVVAFAGIGRPEKFFSTLRQCGADVVAEHSFADHHPFSLQEIASLKESAKAKGALLVTTQKDLVRCSDPSGIHALMIRHVWDEPELFTQWLIKLVSDWRAEQD
jgi:tetraacyldisaccharide 4'-kinase